MTRLIQFANNATSRLAANLSAVGLTATLIPGDGAKFPTLTGGQVFFGTLVRSDGTKEVVKVTARATDTLTIVRAVEAVGGVQTAFSFSAGDKFELRMTAGSLASELDRLDAATFTTAVDKNTNYTVVQPDIHNLLRFDTTTGAKTVTLPLISSLSDDFDILISKTSSDLNSVVIACSGSDKINGDSSRSITNQYDCIWLIADRTTNIWSVIASTGAASLMTVDTFVGAGTAGPFTLSVDPKVKENTWVSVGAAYQQQSSYTLSGTSLTLGGPVPAGVVVEVRSSTPLQIGVTSAAQTTANDGASGTLFTTVQGLIGWVQAKFTALAASAGSSLVGFIQSGTGAVARLVQDELRDRFTANQFGATSTGASPVDDITAINKVLAATPTRATADLGQSRISLTPSKPGFDSNVAAFKDIAWTQGRTVIAKGPSQERIYYLDNIAADGTPVNEINVLGSYHPGIVIDVRTPASYNNVAQATHQRAAVIGSTTLNAISMVFRKDGAGQASYVVRSSIPATASTTGSITGNTLTVASGIGIAIGQTVYTAGAANGVIQGTKITGGSGTTWTVDIAQTVASQAMTFGVDNRRLYELSEVGSTIKMTAKDLTTGFMSWNSERTTMVVPHEFGGQVDIATGSQVNSSLSSFNTDPYLRLNDNNTFVGGLKIDHANTRLSMVIESSVTEGNAVLALPKNVGFMYAATYSGANPNASALSIGKNSTTSRSINATGTVNASGADYAEYEHNNGLAIAKGAIVGFKADGTLTLTHAEAVRFGIKSTNPGYVGGDGWFTEQPPERPAFKAPNYTGPSDPGSLAEDATEDEQAAYAAAKAEADAAVAAYRLDYDAKLAEFNATEIAAWQVEMDAFHARLEYARALVDRIAYAGKVPCNVLGAQPGDYIIPMPDAEGFITGQAVTSPTFEQYRIAVGRVNRILDDGLAEVAVLIH